jgi:hypothetical protein
MSIKKIIPAFCFIFLYGCSHTEPVNENNFYTNKENNVYTNKENVVLKKITKELTNNSFSKESMSKKINDFKTPNNSNSVKLVFCGIEYSNQEACIYGYIEQSKPYEKGNNLFNGNSESIEQYGYTDVKNNMKKNGIHVDSLIVIFHNEEFYSLSLTFNLKDLEKVHAGDNNLIQLPSNNNINKVLRRMYKNPELYEGDDKQGFILKHY